MGERIGNAMRSLLVNFQQLSLQVSYEFFYAARGVGIRGDLAGELAVSQDLHLQFNAFVLRGHGKHSASFIVRRRGKAFVHAKVTQV
jgi:hypothetical protein